MNKNVDWQAVLESGALQALMRRRRNTVVGLGVLAALGYFALPALIAWCPAFFTVRIGVGLNIGVLFTALQYPFGGLIVWLFLRQTAEIDAAAQQLCSSEALHCPTLHAMPIAVSGHNPQERSARHVH